MISTKNKEPISYISLLISILALILGIVLLFNSSDGIFNLIGYIASGILLLLGLIKIIIYFKRKDDFSDFVSGLLWMVLGGLIYLFPQSISIGFSIMIGGLVLFNGINRLVLGLAIRGIDESGSKVFVIEAILLLLLGFIIITQRFLNLIGLFLIIYAISELVGYIYYTSQHKDYSEVLNKKVSKEMKKSEAKDAVIEEWSKRSKYNWTEPRFLDIGNEVFVWVN